MSEVPSYFRVVGEDDRRVGTYAADDLRAFQLALTRAVQEGRVQAETFRIQPLTTNRTPTGDSYKWTPSAAEA